MDFKPHEIDWTSEKISRYWNFHVNFYSVEDSWFTKMVGKGILRFAKKHVKLEGNILDYGMGKGFLIGYLLKEIKSLDTKIFGCDFSLESVKNANSSFSSFKNYQESLLLVNLPSDFQDKYFDLVFFIEVIEHLTDEFLSASLMELQRIIKPGGIIFISTPNNEELNKNKIFCPECGSIFHKIQHVRSFNESSLSNLMNEFGFEQIFCGETNLNDYNNFSIKHFAKRILRFLKGTYKPNLIFIGKKNR